MKKLVADLEAACAASEGNADKFRALKAELDAARRALKIAAPQDPPETDPT